MDKLKISKGLSLERNYCPPPDLTYFYLFLGRWDEIMIDNNVIYLIILGTTNKEFLQTSLLPTLASLITTVKGEGE